MLKAIKFRGEKRFFRFFYPLNDDDNAQSYLHLDPEETNKVKRMQVLFYI